MILSQPPLILIGAQRSGTTLLRVMLNNHPNIFIPTESHFFFDLLKAFEPDQRLVPADIEQAINILISSRRFAEWNISYEALSDELIGNSSVLLPELICRVFHLKARLEGRSFKIWGDKTPEYVDLLPQLRRLFPGSKYIVIYRDARDVIDSLAKRGWQGPTIYHRGCYWNDKVEKIKAHVQSLPGNSIIEIKYEDLVGNTEYFLKQICDFLFVPFSRQMLFFHQNYTESITATEQKLGIHVGLARPLEQSARYKWRSTNNSWQLLIKEVICGSNLNQLGYELVQSPGVLGRLIVRIPYRAFVFIIWLGYLFYLYLLPAALRQQFQKLKFWNALKSKL